MAVLFINNEVIRESLIGDNTKFDLYVPFLINQANRNAQGTRPKVVGQMSELVKDFQRESVDKSHEDWKRWYLRNKPNAIENATDKVYSMILKFKEAIGKIDKKVVMEWVEDLVLNKTFTGFLFQEAILKEIARKKGYSYRLSTPEEESKGIDGYIGETPVSIKPITYKTKEMIVENIQVKIVYYEKMKTGLKVTYDF